MSLSIGKYVFQQLSGVTTEVNALVIPAKAIKPYIVYTRLGENPEYDRDGCAGNKTTVKIDIVASNYINSITIAEEVREILEANGGICGNIILTTAELVSVDEMAYEGADGIDYVQTLTFEFSTN